MKTCHHNVSCLKYHYKASPSLSPYGMFKLYFQIGRHSNSCRDPTNLPLTTTYSCHFDMIHPGTWLVVDQLRCRNFATAHSLLLIPYWREQESCTLGRSYLSHLLLAYLWVSETCQTVDQHDAGRVPKWMTSAHKLAAERGTTRFTALFLFPDSSGSDESTDHVCLQVKQP